MSDELRTLLLTLAVAIPIGLAVGIVLRKLRPDSCKRYAKFCLDAQWKLFAFGFLLFEEEQQRNSRDTILNS